MHQYKCWVRLKTGYTTHIIVNADYDTHVRAVVEGMHGPGSLINWTRL